ncbi:9636_t:CDS:2 [Diversispora eburnea]|uniref:9636_t:CDS:1 n=1 Tax=Diversispora eburnea TaxID=1213867 RepID=A0A9N9BPI3_9GLOM|nr:9636_t:CDS:2 [Diversispora eburnea]
MNSLIVNSGNINIDRFIKGTLSRNNNNDDPFLEWVPFEEFEDVKKIGQEILEISQDGFKDNVDYRKNITVFAISEGKVPKEWNMSIVQAKPIMEISNLSKEETVEYLIYNARSKKKKPKDMNWLVVAL